ncbi:MAG: putative transposase [Firmicutes bacterium]|nr:putative transposase [Bacillota bacterium]MDI6705846.1 transposase [Bacillota bacterium]
MLVTLKVKLLTDSEQHSKLLETMHVFNEACNFISQLSFEKRIFNKVKLQQECYYEVREKFKLSAQFVIRAISKVTESYKANKKALHTFKPTGAIVYDQRLLSFKGLEHASILTMAGRILVPMIFGEYQKGVVDGRRIRGQADLILVDGVFYLLVVVELPDGSPTDTKDFLGVDFGIKNIAVDSDGEAFSGAKVNGIRKRHAKLRAKLQKKGTKSAKRLLKKHSKKERRFATDVNHYIAKKLVAKAKGTGRGIALEDLKGIRERVTVNRLQRRQHNSWAFYQLRQFIQYKATLAGVPVVLVDPRNTSRACPVCGHVDKKNRLTRDNFCCQSCGYAGPADSIAARNIAGRAVVMQPDVGVA